MRSLSQIILLLTLSVGLYAQSPHGKELNMACADCHNPKGWKLEAGTHSFTHEKTQFPLVGMHQDVNCKLCHPTLVFSEAETECVSCHTDMHYQTVGMECERCHTPKSWLVDNINDIHRQSRFPLVGAHITADCYSCHPSASLLRFEPLGVECIDCHQKDYDATTSPNHVQGNFSTECLDCHNINAFSWSGSGFNHSFFPLTEGHALNDCQLCHTGNDYTNISSDCYSCHQTDYSATDNPNHSAANFSITCAECHTTHPDWKPTTWNHSNFPLTEGHDIDNCIDCHLDPNNYSNVSAECFGCHETDYNTTTNPNHITANLSTNCGECHTTHPDWKPANFQQHDALYFPVYSGKHAGTWDNCIECHTNPNNFASNSCIICHDHNQADMDDEHDEVGGYVYSDPACFECHPTGEAEGGFNHNESNFPLTGAHITTDCLECHANGYAGTTVICEDCHIDDYNQSTNPNHFAIGIANDCETCHTTNPEWKPATFPTHNSYYALIGAHATIATDCFTCHNGNYNNTPNTCYACHTEDYNQTNNPNHQTAQFPIDCESCHTQSAWVPSTFDHDGLYFPIYSGAHNGKWDQCSDCHTNPGNYAIFTCLTCHEQGETNSEHEGITGYQYNSDACLACHPDGSGSGGFNHNNTNFPLTGAHTSVDCNLCHENGYSGTSTICSDCHQNDYNQSTNPNHSALGITNDCETCHTTNPDWQPATFPVHNSFYVLAGAHVAIANDCGVCHNGNYNNTPNTCYGCHASDYNQTNDPPHQSAQFPTDCEMCHTQSVWVPSTFNHDGQYFPIYSGSHNGEWDQCSDCHTNPGNYSIFTCLPCHPQGEMNNEHEGIPGYQYNSDACLACHPDGSGSGAFNHNSTNFPLTGGHATVECILCHENGYNGTSTICGDCHGDDFNQTTNPNHTAIGIPNDCATCHTTAQGWEPATFPVHNNYYLLTGAHATISGDCFSCHAGDYNNTPNICNGCHTDNYNQTTNPNHFAIGISNDCEICHTTNPDWQPATFPTHNNYYALIGAHATIATDCFTCHNGNYNNTPNTCYACHTLDYNQTTNPPHQSAQFPTDCEMCHTQSVWDPSTFNHDGQYFPIYSGQHNGEWDQCSDCHTNPGNYAIFTCLTCHQQGETNSQHEGVSGYQYNSNACLACHPDGGNSKTIIDQFKKD